MARRGRKAFQDLSRVACPNPVCPNFGQLGHRGLVSNGSYLTQSGKGRRFQCRTCGRSFCLQTGTVFQGLHTPEEKVISALKVLAKGMPLRKAAALIRVKPDTLRRWLGLMAIQSEIVNQRLLQEPGISKIELTTLWAYVKSDTLRSRAVLWRRRCGWRQGWDAG